MASSFLFRNLRESYFCQNYESLLPAFLSTKMQLLMVVEEKGGD